MAPKGAKARRLDPLAGAHGLSRCMVSRMVNTGLPVSLILAVWAWGTSIGVSLEQDLDGIEYFSGCGSYSSACTDTGMDMYPAVVSACMPGLRARQWQCQKPCLETRVRMYHTISNTTVSCKVRV